MILYPVAQKMDDDNKMPSLVGDDANSTAESSLTHSFYSNSLLSMVRREDISDDDLVHRLSIMSSRHDNSSASAMVTRELMMASYRHQIDIMDKAIHEDDDEIRNLLDMAKRLQMDPDIISDASEFSFHQDEKKQSKLHMPKLPDPPGENEREPGTTTLQRNNNDEQINAYVSASKPPHFLNGDRYRRMNTEENQKMRAQNGTRVDSKQQYIRRKTDPLCYYREEQSDNHKRKPDPIGAGTNNSDVNSATYSEQDADSRRLVALARRISKSGGIEDTSSIEGPNDEEYWAKTRGRSVNRLKGSGRAVRTSHNTSLSGSRTSRNSRHSGGSGSSRGSSGANRQGSRQSSSSKEAHDVINVEKKQQKGMKKALIQFFSGKSDRKLVDSSLSAEGSNIRRQKGMDRTSSRSNSRSSSLSYNDSRQSSMKSVNSRYSSLSRRRKHKSKDASKLTVAEAVYYLNNTERRMTKSTSVSSLKSHTSKKSSASKMSSTSRTSRKSTRSFVSRESNNKKSTTVSKVISAASGLKGKIRRCVVSEKKTTDYYHSSDYSDDESSSVSSSVYS
jgi:hypothetical protein